MTRPARPTARLAPRAGFTLIELLVVIGIIVLLISILLPAASKVRTAAQSARTRSTIAAVAGAIERYYHDERAYPGLFSNAQLGLGITGLTFTPAVAGAGAELTGTENMVAALVGGINPIGGTGDPAAVTLDTSAANTIGKGPLNYSVSIVNRTRREPYIDGAAGTLLPQTPFTSTGYFGGSPDAVGVVVGKDSPFPEFYDNYSTPRPLIYLRANVAATGPICMDATVPTTRYNPASNSKYCDYEFSYYKRDPTPDGAFPGDFQFSAAAQDNYKSFYEYLANPATFAGNSATAAAQAASIPRGVDKFILISAGPDRIFGTRDDIFYGGN